MMAAESSTDQPPPQPPKSWSGPTMTEIVSIRPKADCFPLLCQRFPRSLGPSSAFALPLDTSSFDLLPSSSIFSFLFLLFPSVLCLLLSPCGLCLIHSLPRYPPCVLALATDYTPRIC
ncbi:hypothetical protein BJX64DRAFT_8428 [Aspergillus heterothallicus]